jgi:hypothetical protein
MLHMVLNSVVVVNGINITEFHEIDTNAVICKSLSMNITDCSAYLQEFLILGDSFLELAEIVEKNTSAVIGSTLIS